MTTTKVRFRTREYLDLIARYGEMRGQDVVKHVVRTRGDYTDFYELAGLMHAGFIACDTTVQMPEQPKQFNSLGPATIDAAIALAQLALPRGESFHIENCLRESWHDFPVRIFLTGAGYLKLDELAKEEDDVRRMRHGYWIALGIAVVTSIVSVAATRLVIG